MDMLQSHLKYPRLDAFYVYILYTIYYIVYRKNDPARVVQGGCAGGVVQGLCGPPGSSPFSRPFLFASAHFEYYLLYLRA